MIPFDFKYYKPETIEEATDIANKTLKKGKKIMYYAGGTEFISMARMHNIYTDAIIDIKGIPECNTHELKNNELTIGSTVTLTSIAEQNFFPLLSLTVKRIADHTIQDKITLGGNLAGTIIYREAVLPLMVTDSDIVIANTYGKKRIPLKDIFDKKIQLQEDEMIVKVIIKEQFLSLPSIHVKRTKNEKIDYPLITIVALKDDIGINFAFSSICEYPFRSSSMENFLNDNSLPKDERIKKAIDNVPDKILNDISGSSEYRKFMFHSMLYEILTHFEEVN